MNLTPRFTKMRLFLIGLILIVVVLVFSFSLIKKGPVARKMEPALIEFAAKDFPAHGIFLIVPSEPEFGKNRKTIDPYSVLLRNTSHRAVVGYSIKWECSGRTQESADRNVVYDRNVSHVVSWIFLYGNEPERKAAISGSRDFIKPNSTWLISYDSESRPWDGTNAIDDTSLDNVDLAELQAACAGLTVIADGVFFDDGTFLGPDTTNFFTEVKSQLDARYELLQEIQKDLLSGKSATEVIRGLEKTRDAHAIQLGDQPTKQEFRSYFRSMFARDVLGKKDLWGVEKAFEEVTHQLSHPWVNLRKL